MRVTFNITAPEQDEEGGNDLLSLEVSPDATIGILKESVQAEVRIAKLSQHIYHNGQLLTDDSKTMEQLEITDGDMLALHVRDMVGNTGLPQANRAPPAARRQPAARSPAGGPIEQDPEVIRLRILGNPNLRQQFLRQQPDFADAIESPQRFAQAWRRNQDREREEQNSRARQIANLNADPFDIEAQTKIAEIIREAQVQENLQNAIEHNPEVFGRVHMLYIDVEVNGQKVKAFVDSGAQATIMSPSCAEACGIMRLIDKRFAGIARGVGTAKILGRVHSAQIRIGSLFLACSFTVMEGKDVDILFGLDMLKRYQALIDLSKDKLIIQGVEVPFLGEADIPKNMEEQIAEEPTIPGPGGTVIGAQSGAVTAPQTQQQQQAAPIAPAASSSATLAPRQVAAPPPRDTFPQESIDQLVALGFTKQEAINALQACGGNVEYAAGLLFQG